MKHASIFRLIYSALFAAFIFFGTQFVKLPLAVGYFHIGDAVVLLAGYLIGGGYAAMAAAVGSVLADVLSGYAIYIPATLVIKTVMTFIIFVICRRPQKEKKKNGLQFAFGAMLAEAVMIFGYFLYDTFLYSLAGALAALSGNLLQAVASVVLGTGTLLLLTRTKFAEHLKV